MHKDTLVGAIVCKLDLHKKSHARRGYIAMVAVEPSARRARIGKRRKATEKMNE